jgi:hypothetical protein
MSRLVIFNSLELSTNAKDKKNTKKYLKMSIPFRKKTKKDQILNKSFIYLA